MAQGDAKGGDPEESEKGRWEAGQDLPLSPGAKEAEVGTAGTLPRVVRKQAW